MKKLLFILPLLYYSCTDDKVDTDDKSINVIFDKNKIINVADVPDGWVTNANDEEPDCATNDTDECNVCAGDNSSCADCAGAPNGSAKADNCDTCDNNPYNDCVQDCAGEWGGEAIIEIFYNDADGDGLGAGKGSVYCVIPEGK